MSKTTRLILLFVAIGVFGFGIYFALNSTNDYTFTELSDYDSKLGINESTWDCASVSVEKLSIHDLEKLQNRPNGDQLIFLNFTDNNLDQVNILGKLVSGVNNREYSLNDRGYAELDIEEIVIIQHILIEKSISKYKDTIHDYSRGSDPVRYYDDDLDRWEKNKHRWEGYLVEFLSPTIIYQDRLYHVNGLGSSIRSDNLEETINVQLIEMTEQEYLAQNPEHKIIEIAEHDINSMPAVLDAISQIGTWEISITESQYTGDKIQQEIVDYFKLETQRQLSEFEGEYVADFTYGGNYYRTAYLVC
ncbi:hypothetical protein [Nitrosopumilus sp.]|uniref:hypothetical protein n=1 Tax=Nitrosopumilus sp. TaxID=2024843 RepID=UPI0034A02068